MPNLHATFAAVSKVNVPTVVPFNRLGGIPRREPDLAAPALMQKAMSRDVDPGQSIAYLAMSGARVSTAVEEAPKAVPALQGPSPREWRPAQIKTKETEPPQMYAAPIHKRLELEVLEPPLSPNTAQRAARRAAANGGRPKGSLTPAKKPVRVEWCVQPQIELPSIAAHKGGAFSVTSTPLEEVPSAGQVDDCILAEHYTPCGALRATAPHAASQLHVHKLSSMLVMVKTVRLGELQTARQRHRAVTEWRLLRALRHKHIARLVHVMRDIDTAYEGGPSAETLLLVCEYCAGGSLEAYVTRYGALPEKNAARIVGQLNAALVHCHEREIFHRGVRAANVLLDASFKNCKLADFSSAVRTNSGTLTAASSNELHYQAPEPTPSPSLNPSLNPHPSYPNPNPSPNQPYT